LEFRPVLDPAQSHSDEDRVIVVTRHFSRTAAVQKGRFDRLKWWFRSPP
jgi:hypothetical protein